MSAVDTFPDVADRLPTFERFLTPQEHLRRLETLAAEESSMETEVIGTSEEGRPIHAAVLGRGSETAMMIGGAHANEPVGSMTCLAFLELLTAEPQLRESLDYQFVFVPVADVDGARLNRGWFDGPFTTENYAMNFYRPDATRDVEWRFPFEYERLSYTDPPPENQALANCIAEHQPGFVASFHNAPMGSCFHLLSEPLEELYESLQSIPVEHDAALYRGRPETPYMDELADGIFTIPTTVAQYEWAREHENVEVADLDTGGGTLDFAREHNPDAVQLFTEVPYWKHERAADDTVSDRSMRSVLIQKAENKGRIYSTYADQLGDLLEHLPDGRLGDLAEQHATVDLDRFERRRKRIEARTDLDEPATRAQVWSETHLQPFTRLLYTGPMLRAVERALCRTTNSAERSALEDARQGLVAAFHEERRSFDVDGELMPITELVAIQARSVLTCLSHLQQGERGGKL